MSDGKNAAGIQLNSDCERIVEQANLLRGAYYARSGSLSSLAFVHRYTEAHAD